MQRLSDNFTELELEIPDNIKVDTPLEILTTWITDANGKEVVTIPVIELVTLQSLASFITTIMLKQAIVFNGGKPFSGLDVDALTEEEKNDVNIKIILFIVGSFRLFPDQWINFINDINDKMEKEGLKGGKKN